MAKDILNKSDLTKTEQRLMSKVLSVKEYKPNLLYRCICKITDKLTCRMKISILMYMVIMPIVFCVEGGCPTTSLTIAWFMSSFVSSCIIIYILFNETGARQWLQTLSILIR